VVISLFAVVIGITGKFVGQNEIECTDGAGNVETLTSRNFIIAVGGRPTPLECIGGELAISSDDLFSLVKEVSHLLDHICNVKLPSRIRSKI
jgi:pyruvate/2-oxoglutarate dehydrogenase complex dihydrolipoamide dehydrogenase (E3) component